MFFGLLLSIHASATWMPRDVQIVGGKFINRATGVEEVMNGTNVIMKGPPWIPEVKGDTPCNSSEACSTFNDLDAEYLLSKYGPGAAIRLGVIWAGGQPTPDPVLDPDFKTRLQAFLSLCERHGIRVMLDIHQDAVGTAMCGEGVPMWYTQKYFPHLIGKPVLGPATKFKKGNCSLEDAERWTLHAGDPLYNLLNPCCLAWNAPGGWGNNIDVTDFSQLQITQLVGTDEGRSAYALYVKLLAEAVAEYPAAISIELMNEPPTIESNSLYRMYKACYDAVREFAPDIAIGVGDTGQGPLIPSSDLHLAKDVRDWLRSENTTHLFYAFHCYSCKLPQSVENAVKLGGLWDAAPFMTEFGTAEAGPACDKLGVGWTHYQYNGYCNVPCNGGENTCRPVPGSNSTCMPGMPCAFGACIT